MSAFDPKRTLRSAVERDLRHNSQPNLLYPFGPCWFFRGCSPNRDNPTTAGGDRVNIPAYAWVLANDNSRSKNASEQRLHTLALVRHQIAGEESFTDAISRVSYRVHLAAGVRGAAWRSH